MTVNTFPDLPSRKGQRRRIKLPPDGTIVHFTIADEIRRPQTGLPSKILILERVVFDDSREELRLGYWIIGKKPRMLGRWVWGQFAALMPKEDFKYLIDEAQRRGWISC